MEEKKNITELIASICKLADGIGEKTALDVVGHFGHDLKSFLMATEDEFVKLAKGGKRIVNDKQVLGLIAAKAPFQKYDDSREGWIYLICRKFLSDVADKLNSLNLSSLGINPFLAIALELRNAEDIIEFNLYQAVTRSIVTSWGIAVEKILIRIGADSVAKTKSKRKGRKPDIVKKIGSTDYVFQIKSGPNTMNVDMVSSFCEEITRHRKKYPAAKILLGMTYGTPKMIDPKIVSGLKGVADGTKIGRELWDFVSEETNFHRRVFKTMDDASKGILTEPVTALVQRKRNEILKEWKKEYGKNEITKVFEKFI